VLKLGRITSFNTRSAIAASVRLPSWRLLATSQPCAHLARMANIAQAVERPRMSPLVG
jgi:hypothetical protein